MTFPGVSQVLRGDYTLSAGISPSTAALEVAPQAEPFAESGPLQITFGRTRITFPDCRIADAFIPTGSSGTIITLTVLDRRWKWAFGQISGIYNARLASGKIQDGTEKTPRELAKLLLDAMGERGYTVAELPDESRPETNWTHDNPASLLAELCDSLGCRIVLGLDNRVSIRRVGYGRQLPQYQTRQTNGHGVDPPERPDSLLIVASPTRFETKFRLEAVGQDRDGTISPIDDLTYSPSGGWAEQHPELLSGVTSQQDRETALRTVFRWYRIQSTAESIAPGTWTIPGLPAGKVKHSWQVLPLESARVKEQPDAEGARSPLPATVEGLYWSDAPDYEIPNAVGSGLVGRPVRLSFSVDIARGIVMFSEPIYSLTDTQQTEPAELYLTIGHSVKDEKTRQFERFTQERKLPGRRYNTGPRVIRRDDLARTVEGVYTSSPKTATTVTTNDTELKREADYYLDAATAEYRGTETNQITYAGIEAIEPDGAIQQVSWSVGEAGATTTASRNTESSLVVPSYAERRRQEQAAEVAALLKKQRARP